MDQSKKNKTIINIYASNVGAPQYIGIMLFLYVIFITGILCDK